MKIFKALILTISLLGTSSICGQVTIGSGMPPTPRAVLLDLKAKQADSDNATVDASGGGLLLPRVKLVNIYTLEPFIKTDDADFVNNTNSLKEKLAGLSVYNIETGLSADTEQTPLKKGVYTWDGAKWTTTQVNPDAMIILKQPLPFSFYETGFETAKKLVFRVDQELIPWSYQWYRVTSNNMHVRISEEIVGATDSIFTPDVLGRTTVNANNTGLYRYYCVASNTIENVKIESNIAEVAVGCGAKDINGEWISFMCFNLGTTPDYFTMAGQMDYKFSSFSSNPSKINDLNDVRGTEKIWGGLFQWGRISDGHEKRESQSTNFGSVDFTHYANGSVCNSTNTHHPYLQISKTSSYYGHFISGLYSYLGKPFRERKVTQAEIDMQWRTGRFIANDPCAHVDENGNYVDFWATSATSAACDGANTAWRMPTQSEWGSIYKGGTISGESKDALANTWVWRWDESEGQRPGENVGYNRGFEIKPDGVTTTLFLPASGYKNNQGVLYQHGESGLYWSSTVVGTDNAYSVDFSMGSGFRLLLRNRAMGGSVRCVKDYGVQ